MTAELKCCPFCAEEIRAAAVLCKHCHREISDPLRGPIASSARPGAVPTQPVSGSPVRGRSGFLIGATAGAVGIVGVLAAFSSQTSPTSASIDARYGTSHIAPLPPTVVRIADTAGLEIEAEHFHAFSWTVRDERPCTLTGHVAGLAGGRKDVEILVLTADDLENWKRGLATAPIHQTGQVAAQRLDVALPGPGAYRLVLNNAFSLVTDKVVQVRDMRVTCE